MSKYIELLHRIAEGDNRGDFFINNELLKEIQELLNQPEQRLTPLTSKLISLGNNCHESFIKGVRFAEKMHGITGGEE